MHIPESVLLPEVAAVTGLGGVVAGMAGTPMVVLVGVLMARTLVRKNSGEIGPDAA